MFKKIIANKKRYKKLLAPGNFLKILGGLLLLSFLSACGGGGGGGGAVTDTTDTTDPTTTDPTTTDPTSGTATSFTVGGTVTGLSGTLVLQNNGADDLTLDADGAFTFATALADGSTYAVTVLTQPTGQTCAVSNGTGTVSGASVTTVTVTCGDIGAGTFTIGGTVTGLSGTLVLQNNGWDDLTLDADGAFTFATALADASTYEVTVQTQPDGQTCTASDGSGTLSGANVTTVAVVCENNPPSPPSNVVATSGNGEVTITWDPVPEALSFNVYWDTSTGVTTNTVTSISDASNPYVHAGLENGATYYYVVTAVNTNGEGEASAEVSAIPERLQEVAKLFPSDGESGFSYGDSVSISGDYAIVGRGGYSRYGDELGTAYILERDTAGTWAEVSVVQSSDNQPGDAFGISVAIDGTAAVVGAWYEDGGAAGEENFLFTSGAAYIFERGTNGIWGETAILRAADGANSDYFGGSVAISGNRAVIGAHAARIAPLQGGAAYVFERSAPGGSWTEVAKLSSSDEGYSFGRSVAISGDRIIVGKRTADSAHIFERDSNGVWNEVAILVGSDTQQNDYFGIDVAIDGDIAIVGANLEDGGVGDPIYNAGAAYIFERDGSGAWNEVALLFSPDASPNISGGEGFGGSVSVSGNLAVVGAPHKEEDYTDKFSGAFYLFERAGTSDWSVAGSFRREERALFDAFGAGVSISNGRVIVGIPGEDNSGVETGAIFIYE